MNTLQISSYPDLDACPSSHKFHGTWDTLAVARLIRSNSESGKSPAFLFLGRQETELLRQHLANAFGEEAVTTLHDTYYMGLRIVPVDAEAYICTGGSKLTQTLQAPAFRAAS
jgi:hypothetical protein